jgi:hypothetical protein
MFIKLTHLSTLHYLRNRVRGVQTLRDITLPIYSHYFYTDILIHSVPRLAFNPSNTASTRTYQQWIQNSWDTSITSTTQKWWSTIDYWRTLSSVTKSTKDTFPLCHCNSGVDSFLMPHSSLSPWVLSRILCSLVHRCCTYNRIHTSLPYISLTSWYFQRGVSALPSCALLSHLLLIIWDPVVRSHVT